MTLYSSNKSGRRGVQTYFHKGKQKTVYCAVITLMPGVTKRLGNFDTLDEASAAYEKAAEERERRKKVRRVMESIKKIVRES